MEKQEVGLVVKALKANPTKETIIELQLQYPHLLPGGNRLQAVVGEFYGMLYAESRYPQLSIKLNDGSSNQYGDVLVLDGSRVEVLVQVKTVEVSSKSRRTSPIIRSNDLSVNEIVYLILLDDNYYPQGLWELDLGLGAITDAELERGVVVKKEMGSNGVVNWADNKVQSLVYIMEEYGK